MANLMSRHDGSWIPAPVEDWGRHLLGRPRPREAPPIKLIIAGVVVVGLGFMAWKVLGPDLKRYLKIHSM